ncbi:mannose-1-phosphate guanylyltransferase [Desulfopila aestuarii DSM 18488]|uniref:Mannose-1-phosphate guanylyltransferase n=1 Tax=Desulfopila aestuarii DSM 18488 TaxID=1121416 RepID=A0A1M7Y3T4_9BACT|nr:mannose-1-phosphate guanylyltransferase [Desulfopila aestuarii DSM 18488]
MQAMILAAGFGTRLLPHTRLRPKPLFPLLNEPLLLLTIRRLQRFGFGHIIVNCHHLRGQIVDCLHGMAGVVVQEEETILGTGGGLRQALSLMRDEPLLVTNGDIYHTIDFRTLYDAHCSTQFPVTLAMHDYPRFNTVQVTDDKVVAFRPEDENSQPLAFTGLSVIEPDILHGIEVGRESCIIDHYRRKLNDGVQFGVFRVDKCFWTDMGTPEDYLELHAGLLNGSIPRWQEFACGTAEKRILIDDKARLTGKSCITDWCAIGAATGRDISLARCVVWDGVQFPDGYCSADLLVSESPHETAAGIAEGN